ncbi:MAG: EFR1 family ferrodoxin [Thermotogota bacterium]|nr:EFR1 family ferrodoxin [Thermotogota bacterium]
MFAYWEQEKTKITKKIMEHKKDGIEKGKPLESMKVFLFQGVLFKSIPTFSKLLTKVASHGWNALAYTANENCNGCAICEKICPVHNIHMENGKPIWGDHCANCFACLQWCPQQLLLWEM